VTELPSSLPENVHVQQGNKDATRLGRFATLDGIAHAVAVLGSAESGYITGQVLAADGGLAIM
jgi:3-oxoacyl-[acyl-carrier protein] reductase